MISKILFYKNYVNGHKLYKKKKYEEAKTSFLNALKYNPEHSKCNFKKGMCYFKQEEWEQANNYIGKAVNLEPNNTVWKNQFVQTKRHLGKEIKSLDTLSKEEKIRSKIEKQPNNPKLYDELAKLLNKQGKWWQEVEALKKALELDTNHADWYYRLGMTQEKMNRFEEAAQSIQNAITIKKTGINSQWYYRLGFNLEKSEQINLAKNAYQEAIKRDNKLDSVRYGIGVFHQSIGLWKEASIAYTQQLKNNALDDELYYKLAMSYDRQYEWEEAKKYYKTALAINENRPYTTYRLGFVNERLGLWEEASKAYNDANKLSKETKKDWYYREAYVLVNLQNYKKACEVFLKYDTDVVTSSSKMYNRTEKYELYKDLEINVHEVNDAMKLAKLYIEYGYYTDAYKYLKFAVQRSNEHQPKLYYLLGYTLMILENYEEACEAFKEMKIFQKAYGTPVKPLENLSFKNAAIFTEYYENSRIMPKTILYESFHGASISCNPYAIFLNLLEREDFKEWTHIWVVNDLDKVEAKYKNIDNIVFIKRDTYLYIRYLATTKYLINNNTFPPYFMRKDGQKYLNTWHGTPWKTLGKDIKTGFYEHKNVSRNFLHATDIISPNAHTSNIMIHNHDIGNIISSRIVETGYPRIDLTLNNSDQQKSDLKKILSIEGNRKVILYAPTYRGSTQGVNNVDQESQVIASLLSKVSEISDYAVLFRGHHMTEKLLQTSGFNAKIVPSTIDTNELLSIVDVLITDYSSIVFDYIPLSRPIVYYTYDYETYKSDRGLYFDISELPGYVCDSIEKVHEKLLLLSHEKFLNNDYSQYIERFCPYDNGNATKKVIEAFFYNKIVDKQLSFGKQKHNILIYVGAFMLNGITVSFKNLLNSIDLERFDITIAIDIDSIASYPERLEQFKSLPSHVKILPRIGRMNLTLEDTWINTRFMQQHKLGSLEMMKLLSQAYTREYTRLYGKAKFDTIINFDGYVRFWAILFAFGKQQNTQNVIYLHNDMLGEWREKFPTQESVFRIYNDYDKLISVSKSTNEENKSHLVSVFKIDESKFDYADNLLNPQLVLELAQEPIEDENTLSIIANAKPLFVNMARLSVEKGHKQLIQAFSSVALQTPKAKLLILGDGPLRGELQLLIKELSLEKNIFLLGRKTNPFPYLKKADCFVFSSKHEGQGLVLIEAMILGKPVVCTEFPCAHDVLDKGKNGLIVENSVDGLIYGMKEYLAGNVEKPKFDYEKYQKNAINMFYDKVCR